MFKRFLFAFIPLVSTPALAAPVEEYSRLQTQFVNQLKETSELPRDCRRLFGLSYAAMAACSSMA